jgi:hypothetical protein
MDTHTEFFPNLSLRPTWGELNEFYDKYHERVSLVQLERDALYVDLKVVLDQKNELDSMIENAKGQILDMFDMKEFNKNAVKEIATLLGMKLTKTVNIRCEPVFVGTAEIDIDSDGEDVDWEDILEFSCEHNGDVDADLTLDDVSIEVRDE